MRCTLTWKMSTRRSFDHWLAKELKTRKINELWTITHASAPVKHEQKHSSERFILLFFFHTFFFLSFYPIFLCIFVGDGLRWKGKKKRLVAHCLRMRNKLGNMRKMHGRNEWFCIVRIESWICIELKWWNGKNLLQKQNTRENDNKWF